MAKLKTTTDSNRKINGNTFLLIITIALFAIMYIAGMVIFADKGFAKPQMFLNLFISNAGLLVIAVGQTIVMITGGIDISVGSVTALVCMVLADLKEVLNMDFDKTMNFTVERDKSIKAREILKKVYNALQEKGYNPINQIVGYILSGDPTYITSYNDARNLIRQIERDELLEKMVRNYIGLDE